MTKTKPSHSPSICPQHHISALDQAGGVISLLAAVGLAGLAGWLWRRKPAWLALAGASLSALAGVLWIFRNPDRSTVAGGAGRLLSPCDGEVRSVAEVHEPRFLKAQAQQITIRLLPGDVQIIRSPTGGIVRYRRYELRGLAGAADDALWIGIRQPDGPKVLIKLSASPFWRILPPYIGRRITALIELEDALQQGQVIGHLPLGGEIQVFTPATAQVKVSPGAHIQAGETILAQP